MGNKKEDMGIGTGREESTKQKRRQEPGWMREGNGRDGSRNWEKRGRDWNEKGGNWESRG